MMLDPVQFPAGHDLTSYTMSDYLSVYDPGGLHIRRGE